MLTKRYIELITKHYTDGVIDREFYDELILKISVAGKMTMDIYRDFLSGMEKRGLFDEHTSPYREYNMVEVNADYKYSPETFFHKLIGLIIRFFFVLLSCLLGAVWFGVRVEGRKNLKKTKGQVTVTVTNHMSYLDALLTKRYALFRRQFITVAPFNMKKGFSDYIFKSVRVIPIPDTLSGMKYLNSAIDVFKQKKPIFHFYAERSMWLGYRKPRPQKAGAFFYAYRLNAPVVPILYCFRKPRGLRKLFRFPNNITIKIGEPIYPDATLSRSEAIKKLHSECESAVKRIYEDFYGIPLIYENGTTLPTVIADDTPAAREEKPSKSVYQILKEQNKIR